jgi:hypothetical protein
MGKRFLASGKFMPAGLGQLLAPGRTDISRGPLDHHGHPVRDASAVGMQFIGCRRLLGLAGMTDEWLCGY